jgi:hypothetical protein
MSDNIWAKDATMRQQYWHDVKSAAKTIGPARPPALASIRNEVLLPCLSSPEQKQEYVENKIKTYHEKNNDSATAQGRQYITIGIIYDTLVFARLFLKKLRGGKN